MGTLIGCGGCEIHAPIVGTDSNYNGWGSSSATNVTRDTTTKRSGAASMRCNSGAGNAAAYAVPCGNPWSSFNWVQIAFYVDAYPASTVAIIRLNDATTVAGTNRMEIRMNSSGQLSMWFGGTQYGTTSAAVSTGAWHLLEFSQDSATEQNWSTRIDLAAWDTSVTVPTPGGVSARWWWCGWLAAPGASKSIYFDDVVIKSGATGPLTDDWCNGYKIVLQLPISDAQVGSWTGGAGGTTNLYDAINNTPPIGTASETNLTQIENVDTSPDNATDEYRVNLTTYTNAGIGSTDTIEALSLYIYHGEDAGAGTKTGSWGTTNPSNGVQAAAFGSFTFGDDVGALGTWPTSWAATGNDYNNVIYNGNSGITKGNSCVVYLRKTDTGSRVASICFVGQQVVYTPGGTNTPRSISDTGMSFSESLVSAKGKRYTLTDTGVTAGSFAYVSQIGSLGSGNDQLNNPFQGEMDSTHMWIADAGNTRIVKKLRSDLSYVAQKAISGGVSVRGVCSDGTYIYVMDSDYNPGSGFGRIQKYDIATLTVQATSTGPTGGSPNTWLFPYGACTDGTHLWVCDSWNMRVIKLLCSDLSYVAQIGSGTNASGNDDLSYPVGICHDGTYLYIVEDGNSRVNKRLKSTGAYDSKYGSAGSGDNNIASADTPNVQVDLSVDRLYVIDAGNDRVVVRKASDLTYVTQFGTTGSGNTQFDLPQGAIVHDGYIDVVDGGFNSRIVRWTTGTGLDSLSALKTPAGGPSRSNTDTGMSFSESLVATRRFTKTISDTGFTFSETLTRSKRYSRTISDTGFNFNDTIVDRRTRTITDTGFTFSETLSRRIARTILDTGFAFSESLTGGRVKPRTITDTGFSFSETLVKLARLTRAITDTGSTVTESLATRRSHTLTDTGVTSAAATPTFDKFIGESEGDVTDNHQQITVPSGGVAAGNLVVVGTITNGAVAQELASVTDDRGNTYTLTSQVLGSAQNDIGTQVAYSILTTPLQAGDLITITWELTFFQGIASVAVAYSGINSLPLDQYGTAWDNGFPQSQPVGPSVTTTEDNELLVSWFGTQNVRTFTAPTGSWTQRDTLSPGSDYSYLYEDRIVSSIGTYNSAPTLSTDDYWNAHTLTFKAGSASDSLVSSKRKSISLTDNGIAQGAISRVQAVNGAGATTTVSLTGVAAGSLLIADVRVGALGATVGVSDNVNGAWTQVAAQAQSVDGHTAYVFMFVGSAAGNPTITLSTTSGSTRFNASEWAGASSSPLGATASAQGDPTPIDSGSVSAVVGDLLFGAMTNDRNVPGPDWIAGGTSAGGTWALNTDYNESAHAAASQYVIATAAGNFSSNPTDDLVGGNPFMNVTSMVSRFIAASVIDTLVALKTPGSTSYSYSLYDSALSFPTTPVVDDFSGSLSNWTNAQFDDGNLTLAGGGVQGPGAGIWGSAVYNPITTVDFESYATLSSWTSGPVYMASWGRVTDSSTAPTGYFLYVAGNDSIKIMRVVAGSFTDVTPLLSVTLNTGDKVGIKGIGSRLGLWHCPVGSTWRLLYSAVDTSITATGKIALGAHDVMTTVDDFGGGAVVYDSLLTRRNHLLTDTGSTVTESLVRSKRQLRTISDTGFNFNDTIIDRRTRPITDQGTTFSETLVSRASRFRTLTDTGSTVTESLVKLRLYSRILVDNAVGLFSGLYRPTLLDDFNRADGTLFTGSWGSGPGWGLNIPAISSNEVVPDTTELSWALYYSPLGAKSKLAIVEKVASAGSGGTGVGVRSIGFLAWKSSTSGYFFEVALTQAKLWRRASSVFTGLAQVTVSISVNDLIGATFETVSGQVIVTLFSSAGGTGPWVEQAQWIDTAPGTATGNWFAGIVGYGSSASTPMRLDDFRASDATDDVTDTLTTNLIRSRAISDTGVTHTESLVSLRSRPITDTGVSPSDSLADLKTPGSGTNYPRTASDTGFTFSETLVSLAKHFRTISDTGTTIVDVLAENIYHNLTDTGETQTDSLVKLARLTRTISDTGFTFSETLVSRATRVRTISDTGVTNTDSLVKLARITRALSDTGFNFNDTIVDLRTRPITDIGVIASDSLVKLARLTRSITDQGMTLTDVLAERINHYLTDVGVTPNDTLVKLATLTRAISDTGTTVADSLASRRNHLLTDTGLTQTDSLVKTQWLHFTISDNGVVQTDSLASLRLRPLSDTQTQTDSLVATRRLSITLTDTGVTQTDALIKGRYLFISDTGVTQTDTLVATRRLSLTLSDTGVTNTDSLVKVAGRIRTISDTGVTPNDSLVRFVLDVRVLSDTGVAFSDVLAERIYHYLTDTGVTPNDSLTRLLIATRSISDTGETQTDSLVVYRLRPKTITDTGVTPSDTLVSLRKFFRTNADTLTFTDSLVKLARVTRTISDTGITSSDSLVSNRNRPLTDPGSVQTDSLLTRRLHVLTDTGVTQTDSVNVSSGLNISLSDNGVIQTDTLVATRRLSASLSDTGFNFNDTIVDRRTRVLTDTGVTQTDTIIDLRLRALSDTGITLVDVLAERINHYLTDTGLTQTDTLARYLAATRSISDTGLTQTDSLVKLVSRPRTLTDTGVTSTDSLASRRNRILSTTGVTQTDAVNVSSGLNISISDTGISQTDSLVARRWFHLTASDTGLTQTDSLSAQRSRTRTNTDTGVTQTDSLITRRQHSLTDTGMTLVDVLAERINHYLTTTGLTQTDSLSAQFTTGSAHYSYTLSDTGITSSDSLTKQVRLSRSISTSLTFSDSLAARRSWYRTLTDTGLTLADTLDARINLYISDTGLTQTDTLDVHREYYRFITTQGVFHSDVIPPIRLIRTNLVAGEMYRRYTATQEAYQHYYVREWHRKYAASRGVYRTYYVREWYRRWRS